MIFEQLILDYTASTASNASRDNREKFSRTFLIVDFLHNKIIIDTFIRRQHS